MIFLDFVQVCCARQRIDRLWPDKGEQRAEARTRLEQLAAAQRFMVDDASASAIEHFTIDHLDQLIDGLRDWRPPFERMWLEHDPRPRMVAAGGEAAARVARGEVLPERLGALIQPVAGQIYSIEVVTRCWRGDTALDACDFQPFHWLVDFADEAGALADQRWVAQEAELHQLLPFASTTETWARAMPWLAVAAGVRGADKWARHRRLCEHLNGRLLGRLSRHQKSSVAELRASGLLRDPQFQAMIGGNLREAAGVVRFVLGCLAMLQRRIVLPGEPYAQRGRRLVSGKSLPFFGYRTITLEVPGKLRLQRAFAQREPAEPKRRHEVAASWCYNAKARAGCADELHDWRPLVPEQRYQCRVCGGKRWRRREHQRGDASRGWVHQDRVVKTPAGAPSSIVPLHRPPKRA
jgi:hypothetical protein